MESLPVPEEETGDMVYIYRRVNEVDHCLTAQVVDFP